MPDTANVVAPTPTGTDATARLTKAQRRTRLDELFGQRAALDGEIVALLGEVDQNEEYEDEGATSTEAWTVTRFGVSTATARAYMRVAAKAPVLPHLVGSMIAGEVSLDKVRAVSDVATAETDREFCDQARRHSVCELAVVARTAAERARATTGSRRERTRGTLRFNDTFRTMTLQLPAPEYGETKVILETRAKRIPSDGDTPWDERLAEAHMELISSTSPDSSGGPGSARTKLVVVHVPFDALVDESVEPSELAAELEHNALVDVATVQKFACEASVAVAVDDDVGHTMYEGRARRFPNDAQRREVMRRDRHCRFPGCTNVTFADVHHIVPWKPTGRTDLDNLALVCRHHHGVVHRNGWSMTGNANEELTVVGPTGRVMVSRPSPLWTRASGGRTSRSAG
jgi:Domain of unknown function (DUF222)/HNH endonuclease